MRLLSFDTSGQAIHLCLFEVSASGERIAAQEVIQSREGMRQETSALLMPGIVRLMGLAGWTRTSLDAIVVGQGPGSFTGVRTAVVTARTLAQALRIPLVGVCLLECYAFLKLVGAADPVVAQDRVGAHDYAHSSKAASSECVVVMAAGKGNHFAARYRLPQVLNDDNHDLSARNHPLTDHTQELIPEHRPFYATIEQIAERSQNACIIADEASAPSLSQLGLVVFPLPSVTNIAVTQAHIATNRLHLKASEAYPRDKMFDSFHYSHVEPLYLRGASVTIKGPHNEAHRTEFN